MPYPQIWLMAHDILNKGCFSILSPQEREYSNAIRNISHKIEFIRTRSALRYLLSRLCDNNIDFCQWRFAQNPYGKLFIEKAIEFPRMEFSISHTPGMTAIAVSENTSVGIDVESCSFPRISEIPADVTLCEKEQLVLSRLPKQEQCRYFLELWTVKEAYAKYIGTGVYAEFTSMHVAPGGHHVSLCQENERWAPADIDVHTTETVVNREEFIMSLVTSEGGAHSPEIIELKSMEQLVSSKP